MRQQLETLFAPYPRRPLPPVYLPAEPPQLGRRESHREFPTELARTVASWHIPCITHPDVPALDVLATVLGDGRSSRFYRQVREGQRLAHAISAFSYVPAEPGLFGVETTTDPENRQAALDAAMAIIAEVQRDGITAPELAKAKRVLLSNQLNALVTMRGQASDLGSNWLLTGNLDFSRDYLDAIQQVGVEDIARVARKYLPGRPLHNCHAVPGGRQGRCSRAPVAVPAAAGEIQKFTLSNGLRLLVREDARLPLVYLDAVFRGGLLAETAADNGLTKLFSRVLLKGTANRTAEELAEEIEAVGGSIGSDTGNNSFSISLEVMQPDLDLGLDLLADVVLRASLPEAAVEREKAVQIAALKAEDEHVTSVARNLLRSTLFGNHPYGLRSSGSPETMARIDRDQLVAFQRKFIVGQNGVLAVFGNVRAEEVRQQVETLFASLPPGELALATPLRPSAPTEARTVEQFEEKEQAVLMVGFPGVSVHDPDRHALEVIDEASSDLGSRFFIRIREELGLAYFVGSSQMVGLAPGLFTFYVGTDPQKIEQVQTAFSEEIARLAADGLTEVELTRAKKKLIGKQAIAYQSNANLAYTAALDELYGLGYLHYQSMAADLEKLTLAEVREAAQRYFRDRPAITVIVRPAPASVAPDAAPAPMQAS